MRNRIVSACCSAAGASGSLLCSFSMIAAAVGLFASGGAAAAHGSMSSMTAMNAQTGAGSRLPAWLDALVRYGPWILVASLGLFLIGVGLRRRSVLVPAAVGGAILYVGMYRQSSLAVMYAAIGADTLLMGAAYLISMRWKRLG